MNEARYIVLVPHRDTAARINTMKRRLFEAGHPGAWSFPPVIPLARTETPFPYNTLREAARLLRDDTQGKAFDFIASAVLALPDVRVWGLRSGILLERSVSFLRENGAAEIWADAPLALCVLAKDEREPSLPEMPPDVPPLRISAGFLANMVFAAHEAGERDYSFRWRTGKAAWMPSVR
ncbi:MAG: hypothetical protein LBG72_04590 [Spirochaetaceae bacterium]|jgi:hypothetical protein|nr:hypothetical protein [Spirochaetaceae bacterium]